MENWLSLPFRIGSPVVGEMSISRKVDKSRVRRVWGARANTANTLSYHASYQNATSGRF